MCIRYAVSIEKVAEDKANWAVASGDVFENIANSAFYTKEIYFYPSHPPEPVWLWVLGHEKALPSKAITDRMWQTRWCFHVCVGGKGSYNGDKAVGNIERFAFYEEAKRAYAIIATGESSLYANIILQKGVI